MRAILGVPNNAIGVPTAHPPALYFHSVFLHELHKIVDCELDEGGLAGPKGDRINAPVSAGLLQ